MPRPEVQPGVESVHRVGASPLHQPRADRSWWRGERRHRGRSARDVRPPHATMTRARKDTPTPLRELLGWDTAGGDAGAGAPRPDASTPPAHARPARRRGLRAHHRRGRRAPPPDRRRRARRAVGRRGQLKQAPAGTHADHFILAFARELRATIVSNDTFRDRSRQFAGVRRRVIRYMIVAGEIVLERRTSRRNERTAGSGEWNGRESGVGSRERSRKRGESSGSCLRLASRWARTAARGNSG